MAETMEGQSTSSASPISKKEKKSPEKQTKSRKVAASHPKYVDMVVAAIHGLKEQKGSSKHAILKYIMANYKVGDNDKHINAHVKIALKSGSSDGVLKQVRGNGAAGSFRVTDKKKNTSKSSPKKAKVASSTIKKDSSVKKSPVTKKTSNKKTKTVDKKTPKKVAVKKPAPKKTPVKKISKKSPAKKSPKTPTKKATSKRKTSAKK
ncbi:putative histone H1.6 [Lepeophtheirus salmonis]|uniref:putative histone H1.6 n=1 Tax=Lepeophtheirus salmonis TaxID=72036 RepID=UPI001AE9F371|nr:histone H1-delta-like [Lepeophtheirus salmonis]